MKKIFSEEENQEIYFACNLIRASMVLIATKEKIGDKNTTLGEIPIMAGNPSLINSQVQSHEWERLFANSDWLDILSAAQNINPLKENRFSKFLKVICKYFPEEIDGILVPVFYENA